MEKKKQAALAAVVHYLACEQAALAQGEALEAPTEQQQPQAAFPDNFVGPWALSGRQAQMQMRTMVQMKVF